MRSHISVLLLVVTALFMVIVPISAHVCLYSPPQRGGYVLDHSGESTCYREHEAGPCGAIPAGDSVATYTAGSQIEVGFQQVKQRAGRQGGRDDGLHSAVQCTGISEPKLSSFLLLP